MRKALGTKPRLGESTVRATKEKNSDAFSEGIPEEPVEAIEAEPVPTTGKPICVATVVVAREALHPGVRLSQRGGYLRVLRVLAIREQRDTKG